MKKFSILVLVLGLAAVSYGVVIGDFETGLDGWAQDKDATPSQSTIGATLGEHSMKLEGPGGWHIDTMIDAKQYRNVLGVSGAQLSADVTVFDEDIESNWMQVQMIINGQNNDESGPQNNIGWQQPPPGLASVTMDGQPHTYTWDLPEDLTTKIAGTDDGIWWFEIVIVTNLDGASPMTMYVDNVQAIPEPATMVLLSMGGLSLLRRRK